MELALYSSEDENSSFGIFNPIKLNETKLKTKLEIKNENNVNEYGLKN